MVPIRLGSVAIVAMMRQSGLNDTLTALVLVYVAQGLPLVATVDRALATDIELFSRGGQEILSAIESQNYAVLGRRPAISKSRKLTLVARAAAVRTDGFG